MLQCVNLKHLWCSSLLTVRQNFLISCPLSLPLSWDLQTSFFGKNLQLASPQTEQKLRSEWSFVKCSWRSLPKNLVQCWGSCKTGWKLEGLPSPSFPPVAISAICAWQRHLGNTSTCDILMLFCMKPVAFILRLIHFDSAETFLLIILVPKLTYLTIFELIRLSSMFVANLNCLEPMSVHSGKPCTQGIICKGTFKSFTVSHCFILALQAMRTSRRACQAQSHC